MASENTDNAGYDNDSEEIINENQNRKKRSFGRELLSWIKVVISAVIIALVLDTFVIANAVVPTGSMETTIMAGSRIIGLRLYYTFSEPQRGDIVIFKYPDDESVNYLKRIIGLPGETVEIIDGDVYIDGELLDEPYLAEEATGDFGPYEVPEDCYFMLGDNREVSMDARYWTNTYVSKDKIIAKAIFMYYPSLKWLNNG